MTSKFDAVVFDMDGLLVDSETVWHLAETAMIEARGEVYTDEVRANIIGKRMDALLAYLREVYGFEDTLATLNDELIERMLALIPQKVEPQPGAQALIEYVIAQDVPYAIASSSAMAIIESVVQSQGWERHFEVLCSADDDEHGKPAPDVYLRAARLLGVEPSRCLALEDSPTGARAAVAAGMTCYAVPDTSHSEPAALEAITPHVFESLHQVLEKLQRDRSISHSDRN